MTADLQQVYGVDFTGWLQQPRRLSTRRMYALVKGLERYSSRFWAEIAGHDPLTQESIILSGIFALFAGKPHPLVTSREDREKQQEYQRKKERIKAASKQRKRQLALAKAQEQK